MKLHNDLVMELPGFVPKSFCDHLIQKFENDERKKTGAVTYGDREIVDPKLKSSTDLDVSELGDWAKEDTKLLHYVRTAVNIYNKYLHDEYNYDQPLHTFEELLKTVKCGLSDSGYVIQRQKRGAKYAWHYDCSFYPVSQLFGIIYLNTLDPDEGGCTEFINGRKVRPECGKIMLCPASWTYAHCGNEVKGDYKYTATFMVFLGDHTDKSN